MISKIPNESFVALTDEIADLLMCVELGDKKYQSLIVESNGGESFNDEGLDIYIKWNNQVEELLSTYLTMEDTNHG